MLVLNNLIKLFILKKNEELSNKRKMAGKKLTLNIINDTDSGTAGKTEKLASIQIMYFTTPSFRIKITIILLITITG